MKKTLLFLFALITFNSSSQIVITDPGPFTFTGLNFMQVYTDGELQGTLTSVSLQATLSASAGSTYANDLTIYVTPTSTIALAGLLQVGGYSDLDADEYHEWISGGSSTVGTVLNDSYTLLTPINFTANPTYNIWLGNGYGGTGASGTWTNLTLTLNGVSETPASSDDFIASTFTIYPNPTSNILNVSGNNLPIRKLGITDINGRAIKTIIPSISSEQMNIDVSDLSAGVYLLVIDTEEGNAVKKFIKN